MNAPISNSILHYNILKFLIDHGHGPDTAELAERMQATVEEVDTALHELAKYHGVVLHPGTSRIWVVHPFSMAPTNFLVRAKDKEWWSNCAWCALGAAALLQRDVSIITTLGANDRQVNVRIHGNQLLDHDYCVHFSVPMRHAWDNVIYTCSTMLLFENEPQVERWCRQHRIPRGDVQPIAKVWELAKAWYGNHLNPDWKKWTAEEAQGIFDRLGLTGDIWKIPASKERF